MWHKRTNLLRGVFLKYNICSRSRRIRVSTHRHTFVFRGVETRTNAEIGKIDLLETAHNSKIQESEMIIYNFK